MSDRSLLPGKFVWFELVTNDVKKAQAFYGEVLGWKVIPFPMGPSHIYEMIATGDTEDSMIGGYAATQNEGEPARWISYVSVADVDAVAKAATANGGKVIEAPHDVPTVGRMAGITDPQGAELHLYRASNGNFPDAEARQGQFFWNELHTTDPIGAMTFYEKVVGFDHRAMDMGAVAGTYHIVSKDGVDRGGATSFLSPGTPPHWLPYVRVDDVDATYARAKRLGAKTPMSPEDIPGIGRFSVLQDPTGATLAIMKPAPRDK
jgi:uncharacterized protein